MKENEKKMNRKTKRNEREKKHEPREGARRRPNHEPAQPVPQAWVGWGKRAPLRVVPRLREATFRNISKRKKKRKRGPKPKKNMPWWQQRFKAQRQ
jgi:hypothetical protein